MLRWDDIAMTTVQLGHLRQNFCCAGGDSVPAKEGQGCPFGLCSGRGERLIVTTSAPTRRTPAITTIRSSPTLAHVETPVRGAFRTGPSMGTPHHPIDIRELPVAIRFAMQLAVYFAEPRRADRDSVEEGDTAQADVFTRPIASYFDVRDAVLASVSCASLSYASAAPVMVALATRSTVLSAVERISLERERQCFGSLMSLRSCRITSPLLFPITEQPPRRWVTLTATSVQLPDT